MNPDEWKQKTIEKEYKITTEAIRQFEKLMERDEFRYEKGVRLPIFGHWLYIAKEITEDDRFLPDHKDHNIYWYSGNLRSFKAIRVGSTCKSTLKINDIKEFDEAENSYIVDISQLVWVDSKLAIEEEIQILYLDKNSEYDEIRRINLDTDWEQTVDSDLIFSIQQTNPVIGPDKVLDIFSGSDNDHENLPVSGSAALLMLIESFNYHFESRDVTRFSYKASGFRQPEDQLKIVGRDSDAYVSLLRIINSKKQVLFGVDIRWSYTWETSRS